MLWLICSKNTPPVTAKGQAYNSQMNYVLIILFMLVNPVVQSILPKGGSLRILTEPAGELIVGNHLPERFYHLTAVMNIENQSSFIISNCFWISPGI